MDGPEESVMGIYIRVRESKDRKKKIEETYAEKVDLSRREETRFYLVSGAEVTSQAPTEIRSSYWKFR